MPTMVTTTHKPTTPRKAAHKGKGKAKPASAVSLAPTTPKAPAPTTIQVVGQPVKSYRANTARAVYWQLIQQYKGQPLTAFLAFCKATPPSMPKVGKLAGKGEPPMGWVAFFVRQGLIKLS